MVDQITCRIVQVHEILDLRASELRKGKPAESARFPGDDLPSTLHFGGFIDDRPICCLTLLKQPDAEIPTWQLRGMATTQKWQRQGAGRSLLHVAEYTLKKRYPKFIIWCNAREVALPFYSYMGYRVVSEPFEIEGIGLHHKMEKSFM